jgi:hypothetical protein
LDVDFLRRLAAGFWRVYQRNYLAVLVLTTAVFVLQLYHLYWLFTDVILTRLTGRSFYAFSQAGALVSLVADYLEIPTLISASLLYVNELRKRFSWAALGYLLLLNTQWAHLFWITDEIVVETFASQSLFQWNAAVAWVAILIDYLEVPVILDTLARVWRERHDIITRLHRSSTPSPRRSRLVSAQASRAA